MPLVTIVFGTYKRSHIIGRTLESLVNQSFKDIEIVIIDDNHTENHEEINKTKEVVNSFNDPRIKYFKNAENLGHPAVFRKCFDHITGKYFMLFSDDDELCEGMLEAMVNFLEINSVATLVHGNDIFKYPDGTVHHIPLIFNETRLVDSEIYLNSHLNYDDKFNWSQSAVLYRAEFMKYNKVPIVDNYMWDLSFHSHYLLHSKSIGYINKHICIRNEEVRYTGRLSESFLFHRKIEIYYLILKFIADNQPLLIIRGFAVNKLRIKISVKLLKEFIHISKFSHAVFCLELALKNILKVCLTLILWVPFKIVSLTYGKLTAVMSLMKK